MTMGIYKIKCKATGKVYIGGSVNIEKRWQSHKYFLNNNIIDKCNPYLCHSWQKYKEENFLFTVVERVIEANDLLATEQKWLDLYKTSDGSMDRNRCFNILPTAGSNYGFVTPEKTKQKMSDARYGDQATNTNLTNNQVVEIKHLLNTTKISYQEIMDKYNISISCLRNLVMGRSWGRVGGPVNRQTNSKRIFEPIDILEIRKRYSAGEAQQDIANHYKVSQKTISRIIRKETYKHI